MIVAIISTKIPILLGHDFWIFHYAETRALRILEHEYTRPDDDFGMLLGSLYCWIDGGRKCGHLTPCASAQAIEWASSGGRRSVTRLDMILSRDQPLISWNICRDW